MDRVSAEQPSNQRVYPHCRNTKMKKVLFGCVSAGLAVGGAYFWYKKWQKYEQQCQEQNNEPTLEKSEHFIPNFEEGIVESNGLSVCAKETDGNASNEGETEAPNVHKTEDIDCQICDAESLKPENALANNDETGHGVQHAQDLPLRADGAWNNTSNMPDANLSIFGPNCAKIHLKGTDIDADALYGDMNEFFASLLKAGRVSHPGGEHTTVEPGPMFEAGPSSCASSPSTFGFQPNGPGTKKASKQLANRRRRKKGLRLLPLAPLKQT